MEWAGGISGSSAGECWDMMFWGLITGRSVSFQQARLCPVTGKCWGITKRYCPGVFMHETVACLLRDERDCLRVARTHKPKLQTKHSRRDALPGQRGAHDCWTTPHGCSVFLSILTALLLSVSVLMPGLILFSGWDESVWMIHMNTQPITALAPSANHSTVTYITQALCF